MEEFLWYESITSGREVGDDVGSLGLPSQACEGHLVPWEVLPRVLDVQEEVGRAPSDARALHGFRVAEQGLPGLPSDDPPERRR